MPKGYTAKVMLFPLPLVKTVPRSSPSAPGHPQQPPKLVCPINSPALGFPRTSPTYASAEHFQCPHQQKPMQAACSK